MLQVKINEIFDDWEREVLLKWSIVNLVRISHLNFILNLARNYVLIKIVKIVRHKLY